MEAANIKVKTYADIIAKDIEQKIILLVEVKAKKADDSSVKQLIDTWQSLKILVPFAMLVNLEKIWIYKRQDLKVSKKSIKSFNTVNVLSKYDAEFDKKQIFEPYLICLVEAWLRDLAYHWKSKTPPEADALAEIGLLQRLEGGATESEVDLSPLILKVSSEYIFNQIQSEIQSLFVENDRFSSDNLPEDFNQKIQEASEKIQTLFYELQN